MTTPFEAAFEMQRETIKQSQDLLQQSLQLQQNAAEAFMQNGISAQRSAQQQGAQMFQNLFNAQLDAFSSALDDDEVRSKLDTQFDQNAELTQDVFNAQYEQSANLTRQLFNNQIDAIKSAVDSDEFRDAINSQFKDYENTQDVAWDNFESELDETLDELSDSQRHLVGETVRAVLNAQRQAQDDTVQGVRAAASVTETVHDDAQQVAQTTQQQMAEDVRASHNGEDEDTEDLETIEGLGDTYADRLRSSGIESIDHLAAADAETVANVAEVSEDRAQDWVSNAQSQA